MTTQYWYEPVVEGVVNDKVIGDEATAEDWEARVLDAEQLDAL